MKITFTITLNCRDDLSTEMQGAMLQYLQDVATCDFGDDWEDLVVHPLRTRQISSDAFADYDEDEPPPLVFDKYDDGLVESSYWAIEEEDEVPA